jgi:hypothetical protein
MLLAAGSPGVGTAAVPTAFGGSSTLSEKTGADGAALEHGPSSATASDLRTPRQGSPPNSLAFAHTVHDGRPTHAARTASTLAAASHDALRKRPEEQSPTGVPNDANLTAVNWPEGHSRCRMAFSSAKLFKRSQSTSISNHYWIVSS